MLLTGKKINCCMLGAMILIMVMIAVGCKNNCIKGNLSKTVCNITFVPTPISNPAVAQTRHHTHLIVLVHGTILPIPSWSAFWESTKQKNGSWYQNYLNQLRFSDLYGTQPIGQFGLHAIDNPVNNPSSFSINQLALYFLTQTYRSCSRYVGHDVRCYTFGWDGRLDHKHRLNWGQKLFESLDQEISRLKRQFTSQDMLMVDIFAHSHGGNVALNMVHALHDGQMPSWHVNRLILLGTPVQQETARLIESPLFRHVYNVYSKGDDIQNLDFLSTKASSARRFDAIIDTQKQSKLVQIEIKSDHKKPTHVDFWFFKRWRFSLAVEARDQIPLFVFVPLIFPTLEREWAQEHDVLMDIESDDNEAYAVQLKTRQTKHKQLAKYLESTICCAKNNLKWPKDINITST